MENPGTPMTIFQELLQEVKTPKIILKTIEGITIVLITITIYLLTSHRISEMLAIFLATGYFSLLAYLFYSHSESKPFSPTIRIVIFLLTCASLLFVGSTGWFTSPYFFLLYIVSISLAFLVDRSVFFAFVLALCGILLPQVGRINASEQFFFIVAFLLLIPFTLLVREEFLKRNEAEKKILILKKRNRIYQNTLEELLDNEVSKTAILLRERLSNIRSSSLYYEKKPSKINSKILAQFVNLADESIELLRLFEEKALGNKLQRTPRK